MNTIKVTAVAKIRHAALHAAAAKLGGQAALARHLGVPQGDVCDWCNFKRMPPSQWSEDMHASTKAKWTPEALLDLEKKLFELTGQTLTELFPDDLRKSREFLKASKTVEKTTTVSLPKLISMVGRLPVSPATKQRPSLQPSCWKPGKRSRRS